MTYASTRHGDAYDRGSADRYYGRGYDPHKYEAGTYSSKRIALTDPEEIAAYAEGYEQETDRKIWE